MSFVNRLLSMVNGPGIPLQNDSLFLSQGNSLTTTNTTSLTGLTPTISKGLIRVKVYQGLTSPTLTALACYLSDGVDFVCVYTWAGTVTLSATPAGTALATNGAMAASSAVLTSASNPFTASMVGARIAVTAAGNTGGTLPLYTTIASYQSPGQVTLAAATLQTGGTSGATVTLTEPYSNGGSAGTPGGFDIVIPFEVDINVSRLDVVTTGAGTSLLDVEISGTS
jgi:hypothetical protein